MSNYPDGCMGPPDEPEFSRLQELLSELKQCGVLSLAATDAECAQSLCEVEINLPDPEAWNDDDETAQWTAVEIKPLVSGDDSREAVLASIATAARVLSDRILGQLVDEQAAREARRAKRCLPQCASGGVGCETSPIGAGGLIPTEV